MPRASSLLVASVALAAGALLLWGGARLQGIFVEERDSAEVSITARQQALAQYGRIALERRLVQALERGRTRIDAALANPLHPDAGLLLIENGEQRLPRLRRYREGSATPASDLALQLTSQGGRVDPDDGLLGERIALFDAFQRALAATDPEAITGAVRDILNHESRHVVAVTQELPYRIAFLETFTRFAAPDPSLLQALLRDGLRGTQGRRLQGLQPLLLSSREQLTRADFEGLAGRVLALSRQARVPHDDFDASARDAPSEPAVTLTSLPTPALLDGGRYFAEPLEVSSVRGIGVDLDALLQEITREMRAGQLLGGSDTLSLGARTWSLLAVIDVPIQVDSASFAAERAELARRYGLKTATGVALLLLVAGVGVLVSLLYRRERRYLEGKASLVATMSHELRTPIASLRLMGETLERRLEGVESARDFPSRIVKEADRLSFLVENILSFNRLEKAAVARNREDVTVSELVDEARANVDAFTNKAVEIQVEDGARSSLSVDAELVRLLLSNLIHNSCKYNASDAVRITIEAVAEPGRTVLRFTDNGTGIPAGEWEGVFTEFVRAKNAGGGSASGFGLGLALCRRIMALHDGSIRVLVSSQAGTTFEMIFPAAPVARDVAPAGGAA